MLGVMAVGRFAAPQAGATFPISARAAVGGEAPRWGMAAVTDIPRRRKVPIDSASEQLPAVGPTALPVRLGGLGEHSAASCGFARQHWNPPFPCDAT